MISDPNPPAPFVPDGFDPSDFNQIEPLLRDLLERRLPDLDALRRWVDDLADLMERVDETETRLHIATACHTDDAEIEKAFLDFVRNVDPRLKPYLHKLKQRYLRNPQRHDLYEAGFAMLEMHWQADVDLFREANIPLQTLETERANEYGKITGAMTVEFRGETLTLQQLARFLEETDRPTRERAWRLGAERRLEDRGSLDGLFDTMLENRAALAANAELPTFRDYMWVAKKRFDYTPDDCHAFADAVEVCVLPVVRELDASQRERLGVESLRPWDTAVDPLGRPPLRPFDPKDIDGFVEGVREIIERIDGDLAAWFGTLKDNGNLDLDSRRGKRPGGFQSALEHVRQPFIFMNAAGLQRDVDTMLHEAGHAFHYMAAAPRNGLFVRHAPLEFCEVASMSMELLGCDHYGVFYDDPAEAARAKRQQLEGAVRCLPWIATIDQFQHWLYTNPGHTPEQRTEAWLAVADRFSTGVIDWTGLDDARRAMWQRQLHLYQVPFYYIEYGIAQLGAFGVWLNYRRDAGKALRDLLAAFALGGSRPLPELFTTAGVPFRFDRETIQPLLDAVGDELAALPE